MHLDSAPQCMAYILDKWPRSVLLVRIWMRPIGSIEPAAWANVVSQAAFLPSCYIFGKVHKTTFIIIESTHRHFCTRLSLIKTISKIHVLGNPHKRKVIDNIYLGWDLFILQVERSPKLIIWCKYYDLHLLKDYSFITYAYCIF